MTKSAPPPDLKSTPRFLVRKSAPPRVPSQILTPCNWARLQFLRPGSSPIQILWALPVPPRFNCFRPVLDRVHVLPSDPFPKDVQRKMKTTYCFFLQSALGTEVNLVKALLFFKCCPKTTKQHGRSPCCFQNNKCNMGEARVVAKTTNTTRVKPVLLPKQQILACVVVKTTNYYVKCCF